LVVALNILGKVVVNNESNVWFVYPHAESDRRNHDLSLIFNEALLASSALFGGKARVVGLGFDSLLGKV
jgi:hypothetical protein